MDNKKNINEMDISGNVDKNAIKNISSIALKVVIENTKDMVFIKDANLKYIAVSNSFIKMMGKEHADEVIGFNDLEILEDESLARRYISDDRKLLANDTNLIEYIEPLNDEDGNARYASTSKYILKDDEGNKIGLVGISKDITKDYIARQNYQRELRYLFELPKYTYAVSYIDIDDWRIISQRRQLIDNNTFQSCYTVEELCDAALESIVDKKSEVYEFYDNFDKENLKKIFESGRSNLAFEYQRFMQDNTIHWVHNELKFLTDVDTGHLCIMLLAMDIDAEKDEEQKLILAAKTDKMTMLLNRETTMECIMEILLNEADKMHVLYMMDIDNFKSLNDTYGHQAGDEFLINFATSVKKHFRESDVVGRIGGDEFFALMKNIPNIEMVERKAEELLKTIQGLCVEYKDLNISGSIGISIYPKNGMNLEELYAKADEALYKAKQSGKDKYIFS